jgi:hypothetical protein
LGTQVLLLGLFARDTDDLHASARAGPGLDSPQSRWFTLERGLVIGLAIALAGLAINLGILIHWIWTGFGPLFAIRLAIVALTLMVVGTEILFSSFYLDLLRATRPEGSEVPTLEVSEPATREP